MLVALRKARWWWCSFRADERPLVGDEQPRGGRRVQSELGFAQGVQVDAP